VIIAVALIVAVVLLLADTSWAATDWKAQAQKNYHHAVTHSRLVGGGHVIEPREEAGYYREACRLNRYVERTWRKIRNPQPLRNAGDWAPLLKHEGWPSVAVPHAIYIIRRESGGRPEAKNPTSSATGLFQILATMYPGRNLYDPVINVDTALQLYRSCGWSPWRVN